MSFPRYKKYKASGVEWLGEVPEGWEVKPLKYSTLVYTGNSLNETEKKLYESTDPESLPYISSKDVDLETHEVQYENGLRIPKGQSGLKVAQNGTFLLCVEGGSAGRKVALLRHDVCFVNKLCCFSSRQNNKFRFYFAQSQNFKDKFGLSLTGLIGGVSTSLLKGFQIPTPSDPEQTAIAEFLDRETGKIDELVAEQRRLMELLKVKRQAVISHAVTKGLNPHAPMKPSGIEWLGDVPEGWEVGSIKHFVVAKNGAIKTGPFGSHLTSSDMQAGPIKVYNQRTVIDCDFISGDNYISEDKFAELANFETFPGDLLITTRGTIGRAAILPKDSERGILHPCLLRLQPNTSKVDTVFLKALIQDSDLMKTQLSYLSNATTIEVIYSNTIASVIIPVPPLSEQREILQFIADETAKFDTFTAEAQRAIDLLQERRTALISAAVTGQIDVRQPPRN